MDLGLVGLGKMGGNMRERLRRGGHTVVGYDRNPDVSDVASRGGMGVLPRFGSPVTGSAWQPLPGGLGETEVGRFGTAVQRHHRASAAVAVFERVDGYEP